jgi:hypothetical protein
VQHFLPQDISHSGNQTDLRNRKRDGILVMRTDVEFSSEFDEFREQFDDVVDMDTLIEDYRDFYVKDLSERLGIGSARLPPAYTTPALLNPMFGNKPVIVGSGLMNE